MYELVSESEDGKFIRTYRNTSTGTLVKTYLIKENDGVRWFGFQDLFKIPMIRMSYARHITDLYNTGLTLKDVQAWCQQEKELLRSDDPEKYEKLYSLVLEKERLATFTADPIKQHLALCTVYILADDERIDYFDEQIAEQKLKLWQTSPELVAFFLSWHNGHIQHSLKLLEKISGIASKLERKAKAPARLK